MRGTPDWGCPCLKTEAEAVSETPHFIKKYKMEKVQKKKIRPSSEPYRIELYMFCVLKCAYFLNPIRKNTTRYFPTYCTCASGISDTRMYSIAWQIRCSFSKRLSFFHSAITHGCYVKLALKFCLLCLDSQPLSSFVPVILLLFMSFNSCSNDKKPH